MNPKPLSFLNHLTVPVAIAYLRHRCVLRTRRLPGAMATSAGTYRLGPSPNTAVHDSSRAARRAEVVQSTRTRSSMAACPRGRAGSLKLSSFPLLEYQPVVVQQLALKADSVGAHAGGEREPEVGTHEPAREEHELEQRLLDARRADPRIPLGDRLDVVEPAVAA